MRKQTKIVAALSATALLALGASAMTFAAGWDNSTGNWQYLGNDGAAVTDAWRKSGDYWFYLGSDGNMAVDQLVERDSDYYYVNQDGAMVTNQWVALDADDDGDADADYRWYYFGADGKAYRDKNDKLTTSDLKTINGKKYAFDQDGRMLYGWVNSEGLTIDTSDDAWKNADYYFGGWNDGSAQNGWVQLSVVKDDGDTDMEWFYFNTEGKKQTNKKKTINGATYYFDADGLMIDEWSTAVKASGSAFTGTVNPTNSIVYVNGDGAARKNQWIWAVPTEDYNQKDHDDDEYSWWWANANGQIFKDGIKKIKGKTYIFDEIGRMLSGVVSKNGGHYSNSSVTMNKDWTDLSGDDFKAAADAENAEIYFCSDNEKTDGSRKTGYQNVSFDDDVYQMYFGSNGKAENGYVTKIKKYVSHGIVLKADNDNSNYAGVKINSDNTIADTKVAYSGLVDADYVLINNAGTVQKKKFNLKDNNDVYYVTDKSGYVKYMSEKKLYNTKNEDHKVEVPLTVDGKTTKYYTE